MKNGADVKVKSKPANIGVLHLAAQNNKVYSLTYFYKVHCLDITERDNEGCTPLHWACLHEAKDAVNFLLAWSDQKSVNIKDNQGQTALHIAIR